MENNTEELIKRSQRGDTDAFQKLAQSYKSRIYSLALRMLGNPTDAEDAAEESVIKLYYSMKSSADSPLSPHGSMRSPGTRVLTC